MSQPTAADLRRNILSTAPKAPPYAGFWPRVSAHAIDGTAVLVASYLFNLVTAGLSLPAGTIWAVNIAGYLSMAGSYFVLQESSLHQATFGKRCLGLRVVSAQSHQTLSPLQALARNLYKIALGVPVANILAQIFSLSCFLVPFTSKRQSGADLFSGAIVLAGPKPLLYAQFEKAWMLAIFALIVGLPVVTVSLGFGAEIHPSKFLDGIDERFHSASKSKTAAADSGAALKLLPAAVPSRTSSHNPLDDIEAQLEKTLQQKPRKK